MMAMVIGHGDGVDGEHSLSGEQPPLWPSVS